MLINLGAGLPRNQYTQPVLEAETGEANGNADEDNEETTADDVQEPDDRQLLSLVIEELDERFPGEQGEAQIERILKTVKTEYDQAHAAHAAANGNAMDASEPK